MKKAALALSVFDDNSLSNLVFSDEGELEETRSGQMVNVGIGITDLGYQKGSFIYSDDISNGIHTSGGDKKINDAISSLQSMFRKVKDGGNAIIAACQVIAKTEVLLEEISQKQ